MFSGKNYNFPHCQRFTHRFACRKRKREIAERGKLVLFMNGKPMNLNRESYYSKIYAQLDFNTVQNGIRFNRSGGAF